MAAPRCPQRGPLDSQSVTETEGRLKRRTLAGTLTIGQYANELCVFMTCLNESDRLGSYCVPVTWQMLKEQCVDF